MRARKVNGSELLGNYLCFEEVLFKVLIDYLLRLTLKVDRALQVVECKQP